MTVVNRILPAKTSSDSVFPPLGPLPRCSSRLGDAYPFSLFSTLGMLRVSGYTPAEGDQGVLITAQIDFFHPKDKPARVRLVLGNKALATQVRPLTEMTLGKWELEASVPPFDRTRFASNEVPMTVQALTEQDQILDSLTFGSFKYRESECDCPHSHEASRHAALASKAADLQPSMIVLSSSPPGIAHPIRTPRSRPQPPRQRSYLIRRRRSGGGHRGENDQIPVVEFVTPYEHLAHEWNEADFRNGRRLVRFSRAQQGHKLLVSCEVIKQEDYRERDIVISCIYRPESRNCVFTSVDIIYLLENLVDCEFEVAEKNRIRRNLEGLRPTTVSKNRRECEDFYQRIMEFPDPQPRKIEKSLKVFVWEDLAQALDKIISKYGLYSAPSDDSDNTCSSHPVIRPRSAPNGCHLPKYSRTISTPETSSPGSQTTAEAEATDGDLPMPPQVNDPPSPRDTYPMLNDVTTIPIAAPLACATYYSQIPVIMSRSTDDFDPASVSISSGSQDSTSSPESWISSPNEDATTLVCNGYSIDPESFQLTTFDSTDFAGLQPSLIEDDYL